MDTTKSNKVSVRASRLALHESVSVCFEKAREERSERLKSHAYTQSLGSTTKLSCFGKFCMPLGYCSFLTSFMLKSLTPILKRKIYVSVFKKTIDFKFD